jgi:hypothetical protein
LSLVVVFEAPVGRRSKLEVGATRLGRDHNKATVFVSPHTSRQHFADELHRASAALAIYGVQTWSAKTTITVHGSALIDPAVLCSEVAALWGTAPTLAPASGPAPTSGPAPASGSARSADDEVRVSAMAIELMDYLHTWGANAPDFSPPSSSPAELQAVYKYIRMATNAPDAPDAIVEEVRRRQAADYAAWRDDWRASR